ncbi:MAG: Uncharacterised protein [Pseudidiomarina mangrovi]|nr:MAG: Uncharacterised protein [Pseudidiomarina mangrovi]
MSAAEQSSQNQNSGSSELKKRLGGDLLAFAAGIYMASTSNWDTGNLIWGLWLSSLVVGYCMLGWYLARAFWLEVSQPEASFSFGVPISRWLTRALAVAIMIFFISFFSVHFSGFHFIHSIFVNFFFPIDPSLADEIPTSEDYWLVVEQVWLFVPLALWAERDAFFRKAEPLLKLREGYGEEMMAPYRQVIRLHLLIFFFAFAMWLQLPPWLIYTVVYFVYFFPWKAVKQAMRPTPQLSS